MGGVAAGQLTRVRMATRPSSNAVTISSKKKKSFHDANVIDHHENSKKKFSSAGMHAPQSMPLFSYATRASFSAVSSAVASSVKHAKSPFLIKMRASPARSWR